MGGPVTRSKLSGSARRCELNRGERELPSIQILADASLGPKMENIMALCLETERLRLRHFTAGDVPAILELFSDPEVNTFLPW